MTDTAPAGWNQRIRRGLPFAPGTDGERFEAIVTRHHQHYQLNLSTFEVFYRRTDGRYDQPAWLELPDMVRERIVIAMKVDATSGADIA